MAISPKDLVLTDAELAEVMELEVVLDEGIKRLFTKSEVDILVPIGARGLSARVRDELIRRYKNAGWPRVEVATHGSAQFIFGMR